MEYGPILLDAGADAGKNKTHFIINRPPSGPLAHRRVVELRGGIERHPLAFPKVFRAGDRQILEVSVLLDNRPGVLARMAGYLGERGINILSGVHHDVPASARHEGWWCFFVECREAEIEGVRTCVEEIGAPEGVRRVLISRANVGNLAVDRHHSVQLMGLDRVVTFRSGWIDGVFREIYRRWGDDGRRMVYLQGFYGGRRSYRFWREAFGLDGRELAEAAFEIWVVLGWAKGVEIAEFDPEEGSATLRVDGSFEAAQPADRPACHFLLGAATGFLSEMFGVPLFGEEPKCQAVGDDHCEFTIRKKPFVFPE